MYITCINITDIKLNIYNNGRCYFNNRNYNIPAGRRVDNMTTLHSNEWMRMYILKNIRKDLYELQNKESVYIKMPYIIPIKFKTFKYRTLT